MRTDQLAFARGDENFAVPLMDVKLSAIAFKLEQ
jgi:hypothetical protein